MKLKIDGAVILITGASAGIGTEFARQLAGRARTLILVARRGDRLRGLRDELLQKHPGLAVATYECDLTQQGELESLVSRIETEIGDVDILINNAGMGDFALYEAAPWPKVEQMLRLNIMAPAYLTRRLLRGMVQRGRGGVLNVSSLAGYHFFPGFAPYVGSKFFINGFTESLRTEVGSAGVVVSQLCPGPVATEFESVAASDSKARIPGWLHISASECAKAGIHGFERGRAFIVPGFLARGFASIFGSFPLCVRRTAARMMALSIRKFELSRTAGIRKA
jgi:short-subunit dehydrogenase